MIILRQLTKAAGTENGSSLIENLVGLAIMGCVAVVLASGLWTSAKATVIGNEQTTGESLARSQLEYVQSQAYLPAPSNYLTVTPPDVRWAITTVASAIPGANNEIQNVTVNVTHNGKAVINITTYRAYRVAP